ncbi:MAG: TIGR03936 family radical SAM-associated protein, partial [Acidobacteriota bacterium]
ELSGHKVALSLSSLRPKGLSSGVAENILKVRKTGFTLVPEAGTDRLRRVINKCLTNEEILSAAANAFSRGWRLLKLYFMVGLPTETERDLEGLAGLVEEIIRLGKTKLRAAPRINLSLSSFIPKPHTPFQWLAMEAEDLLKEKQRFLRSRLGPWRSVVIKAHPAKNSILEAVFSRGDRRLGPALLKAWGRGARFDSWKDFFEFSRWEEGLAAASLDYGMYLGPLGRTAALPWDHVGTGIKKSFLLAELDKALREEATESCLEVECAECRGCEVKTRPQKKYRTPVSSRSRRFTPFGEKSEAFLRYEVFYSKSGSARFLSHRDVATHLRRNLRRARIEVAHSKGFHPKMRVSYSPALPLGMAAREDCFEFRASYRFEEKAFLRRLNKSARPGIRFLRLRRLEESERSLNDRLEKLVYSANLKDPEAEQALAAEIQNQKSPRRTEREILHKKMAAFLSQHPDSGAKFWLDWRKRKLFLELPHVSSRCLRPQDIIAALFNPENPVFLLTRERLVFRERPTNSQIREEGQSADPKRVSSCRRMN